MDKEILASSPSAENIRNLAYAIGALLAAVGISATIPFQLIKVWVNERLAKTTEQGHMTDRITKAVEQLGAEKTIWVDGDQQSVPNLEVRLGGIYALERIAQDSIRDHITVMKILTAYIRENAPAISQIEIDLSTNDPLRNISEIKKEVGTALRVIARRNEKHIRMELDPKINLLNEEYFLDLRNTNLQKGIFPNANFDYALFNNSNLQGCYIKGSRFRNCDFTNSKLDLAQCSGANFSNAIFRRTSAVKTNFSKDFRLGASSKFTEKMHAYIIKLRQEEQNISFTKFGAKLRAWAKLNGAFLTQAVISESFYSVAIMKGVDFNRAILRNADMTGVDLTNSKFGSAQMEGEMLDNSNLSFADLRNISVDCNTTFQNAQFFVTAVLGVNFTECSSVTLQQFQNMHGGIVNQNGELLRTVFSKTINLGFSNNTKLFEKNFNGVNEFYDSWRKYKLLAR